MRKIAVVSIAAVALLGAACSSGSSGSSGTHSGSKLTSVTLLVPALTPDVIDVFVAQDQGLFAKQGLKVNVVVASGGNVVSTVAGGHAEFGEVSGFEVLNAAQVGAKVVSVADVETKWTGLLYAKPSIKTAAQLKGGSVGQSTPGSLIANETDVALDNLGLSHGDVTFVSFGRYSNEVAALLAGSIKAGLAGYPIGLELMQKGYHSLIDMRTVSKPAPAESIITSGGYAASHRTVVQAMVNALFSAAHLAKSNKAILQASIAKHVQGAGNAKAASLTAAFFQPIIADPPAVSAAHFTGTQQILAKTNPKIASLDLSSVIDSSFSDHAQHSK